MNEATSQMPFDRFIQIPGPNPILTTGGAGAWDEHWVECCDVYKEEETYYLYYHGTAKDRQKWPRGGYRIGVATAPHPLGPWTRYDGSPILDIGPEGSWEDASVACAFVLKEGKENYCMWYSGMSTKAKESPPTEPKWSIGLAKGPSPLGPWTKCPANPILPKFGYVGGVIKLDGKYRLYTEHPISSTAPDYGPISLATSDAPEGPWTPYEDNPVLEPGDCGAWDEGGFSEAEVSYRDGLFHMFYGAAKPHAVRIQTQESIGYAWSRDGRRFTKHPGNPVAMRERDPDAAAFAEVHHLVEPPLIYLFHTLRYASRPGVEDLGVQVLATARPFCIPMPVLDVKTIAPHSATELGRYPAISLEHVRRLSLTAECAYHANATAALRLHIRSSPDGRRYDTDDFLTLDNCLVPGGVGRKTWQVEASPRFIKVIAENLDATHDVSAVRITAVLKG